MGKLYDKLLRKKHWAFKNQLLNNLVEASNDNTTEFWKKNNNLKEINSYDPSSNISPQEWLKYFQDLISPGYHNKFDMESDCKYMYVNCCYDPRIAPATVEEIIKTVKELNNENVSCFDRTTINWLRYHVMKNCKFIELFKKSFVYPSSWRINFIKPLFNGGCTIDPPCYKRITVSRCLNHFFF